MRINVFVANATGLSRRAADRAIAEGRVEINGQPIRLGQTVNETDRVSLDKRAIIPPVKTVTIMLNKPVGYVCSRVGQGSRTVYNLLPPPLRKLKPIGRLDKDSSGLLLMTDDGQLSYKLTHPSFQKTKVYQVRLNKVLSPEHLLQLNDGIMLHDGISKLDVRSEENGERRERKSAAFHTPHSSLHTPVYEVHMQEGRNRQIRRTFGSLGYVITKLHRTHFGTYPLGDLKFGTYRQIQ